MLNKTSLNFDLALYVNIYIYMCVCCLVSFFASFLFMLMFSVRLRLKSVKSIQKITKSMKMVSAAKYAKAERDLKPARQYGEGAKSMLG